KKVLEDALKILEKLGERGALARTLNQLGLVIKEKGDAAGSRAAHEKAYQVAAEAEDRRQRAVALRNLANLDREAGDFPRAVRRPFSSRGPSSCASRTTTCREPDARSSLSATRSSHRAGRAPPARSSRPPATRSGKASAPRRRAPGRAPAPRATCAPSSGPAS